MRALWRKFVEIALARRITERYSKDQVLEFYLNRVYFRARVLRHPGRFPGLLRQRAGGPDHREAASIAALIKNPNGLSPLNNPASNLKAQPRAQPHGQGEIHYAG